MSKHVFREIHKNSYSIREPLSGCVLYLLVGSQSALLIDTGMGIGNLKAAVAQVTDKPVMVVNTHGHLDHIANNFQFEDIYLSEKDKAVYAAHRNPRYVMTLLKNIMPGFVIALLKKKLDNMINPKAGGTLHYIPDGYKFDLGDRVIEVIEAPGHTPGSICLLDRETRALYSGDSLCDIGILLNLDYCLPPKTYLTSVENLSKFKDEFDIMHPGHRLDELNKSYLDKYIACAKGIVSGELKPKSIKKGEQEYLEASYEDIAIDYHRDSWYPENWDNFTV